MLKFRRFVVEYLTPTQYEKYSSIKMKPEARSATDHFFGKDNDQVKENLKGYESDKSEVHKKIERHLGKEIRPDEYQKGTTQDKYGRETKIGKIIKDEKLRNEFASDNTRAGTKKPQQHYVTVVRGTEVAGQTNSEPNAEHPRGHSWRNQSCKNIEDGMHREFLKKEIKHGSTVVRVHDHTGQEIYRATLQPHHNDEGHTVYALNSEYGIKHPAFTAHAHDVAKRLSGEHKGGSLEYRINSSVYNDSPHKTTLHPDVSSEHLHKALDDEKPSVRRAAARHPNATSEHLHKALDDKDFNVRWAAAIHPNATSEHLHKALDDKDFNVRCAAAMHPNATSEHLHKALNGKDADIRRIAAMHPNATSEHLDKALDDKDANVRRVAAMHPNATSEHLRKALNDKDPSVQAAAAKNPNA